MAWRGTVYNKEGNQINWLDNWSDVESMLKCAFEDKRAYTVEIGRPSKE